MRFFFSFWLDNEIGFAFLKQVNGILSKWGDDGPLSSVVDSASCENLAGAFILIYDELHNQAGALIVRGEGTSRGLICTCGSPKAVAIASLWPGGRTSKQGSQIRPTTACVAVHVQEMKRVCSHKKYPCCTCLQAVRGRSKGLVWFVLGF